MQHHSRTGKEGGWDAMQRSSTSTLYDERNRSWHVNEIKEVSVPMRGESCRFAVAAGRFTRARAK